MFPESPAEAKKYVLTNRFIRLPGFVYASGNSTPSDYEFAQRVRDVFEQSGMNNFLASVK